jgi:CHAT domain
VTTTCPDAETLAAFVEGRIARERIAEIMAHIDQCPRCTRDLAGVNAAFREQQSQPRRWWLAAVAAIVVVALALTPFVWRRDGVGRLVSAAPRDARIVEPRLAGGFAWATYRGPQRDTTGGVDPTRLRIAGIAGDLVDDARKDASPDAQHAAGVALLLIEKPQEAVDRLHAAATKSPDDRQAWNDLAAAQYAAALRMRRPSLYPAALASVDRALQLDARYPEALFNRALILGRMGLTRETRDAWERYLAADPSSSWAAEAREHLAQLPETTSDSELRPDLPKTAAQYPQAARSWGEVWYLGQWAKGNDPAAMLAAARTIGDTLAATTGEVLLRDAVRAIERSDRGDAATIAAAHAAYFDGRLLQSKQQPQLAERELRRAQALFAQAGDPMASAAAYHAAIARFDQHDIAAAREELLAILDRVDGRYTALSAQVRWQLALCEMVDANWSAALAYLTPARDAFAQLGEKSNLGFIETLIADAQISMGHAEEAWSARLHSFTLGSAEARADRLAVSLGAAARMEMRAGRFDSARALLRLEQDAQRTAGNDPLVADALTREAVLNAAAGDENAAQRNVAEAAVIANRIGDPSLRARALADVQFARGAVIARRAPADARALLTQAIDTYRSRELPVFLPESYLLRARAERALGHRDAAMGDVDAGIAALGQHRQTAGTGVIDAARELFEEAVDLALEHGDTEAAFAYADRSRVKDEQPVSAAVMRERLRGTGVAIVETASVRGRSVQFVLDEHSLRVTEDWPALSAAAVIIVGDPRLHSESVVGDVPIAFASSAASLQREELPRGPRSAVAIALASPNGAAALPESEAEVAEIAGMYARGQAITQATRPPPIDADVVHISGHNDSWRLDFRRPPEIAVLAACESLPGRTSLAARDVIGTLSPVADRDARELFREFHRELAAGASPAEALRRARAGTMGRSAAWRSVVLFTRRIPAGGNHG